MHHRAKDITGLTVGYLTAVRYAGSDGAKSLWEALCHCGKTVIMPASEMKKQKARGIVASCGCMRKQTIGRRNTKHGMSAHPAYGVWRSMVDRCSLPSHQAWKNYGGRGILVCESWLMFENFWADMGPTYRVGYSLDRRDNSAGYNPLNCAWRTSRHQANNKRSNVVLNTPNGRMTLSEAAAFYQVGRSTLEYRLSHGWTLEQALTVSPDFTNRKSTI